MNKRGFTLVEVLASITIIALLFGIGVPAYNVISKQVKQSSYDSKVSWALTKAESWASDTGESITNISHLIEEGYLEADNEYGAFNSPIDNHSMLCYVIGIDYVSNQYSAYLTGEEYCDYSELENKTSIIELIKLDSDRILDEDEWTKSNVNLRVQFKNAEDKAKYQNSVEEIEWRGNSIIDTVAVHGDFESKSEHFVEASQIMNTRYEVVMKIAYEGKTLIYKAYTQVKIDRQNPIIYQDDISIDHFDEWTNSSKSTRIVTSDFDGSGVYGYYLNESSPTCSTNKADYQKLSSTTFSLDLNKGEHHVCVIDNVGNVSDSAKINVVNIDDIPPTVNVTLDKRIAKLELDDDIAVVGYFMSKDPNVPTSWTLTEKKPHVTASVRVRSPGTYYVYAIDQGGNIGMMQFTITPEQFSPYPLGTVWNYEYTGGQQTFNVPVDGYYYITVRGTKGGNLSFKEKHGGYGSVRGGRIFLQEGTVLYIYVGGSGEDGSRSSHGAPQGNHGGYNGGADSGYDEGDLGNHGRYWTHGAGGGATDVRLGGSGVGNQIIVAAGGGGADKQTHGTNADTGRYNGKRLNGSADGGGGGYYGGQEHCGGMSYVSGSFTNVISQNGNSGEGRAYIQLQDWAD